jgi:hypothetical protein
MSDIARLGVIFRYLGATTSCLDAALHGSGGIFAQKLLEATLTWNCVAKHKHI